jgi:four helix bundle protein
MSGASEALKERCMSFAVSVLSLVGAFPNTIAGQTVARQLAKSATSVGANYRAACTARSISEFVAKLCIVNEEADETVYWLELAARVQFLRADRLAACRDEAIQLRAIFGRSLRTARNHLNTTTNRQ